MAEKYKDISVNITLEDVINSAEFSIPLIYRRDAKGTIPFTKVNGYDEAFNVLATNAIGALAVLGTEETHQVEMSTIETEYADFAGIDIKTIYTTGDNTITYNGVTHKDYLDIGEGGSITFTNEKFDNRPVFHLGITNINDNEGKAGSFDVPIYLYKNDVLYKTYTCSNNKVIYITELLTQNTKSTDTYKLVFAKACYCFTLGIKNISYQMLEAVTTYFSQENGCEEVALCMNHTEPPYEEDWRQLIWNCTIDEHTVEAARTLLAKNDKRMIYILSTYSKAYDEWFKDLAGNDRVVIYYNTADNNGKGCKTISALVGKTASKPVGSFTYKNQELIGVPVDNTMSKSELNALHEKNINSFVTKVGYNVTSEGKTMSGEYIDIVDSRDWLVLQIEYQLQQALIINDKVPYTNEGISLLENIVVNILQEAFNNGMIATDDNGNPAYSVNFAPRSETKAEDREVRQYVEGNFEFYLAGAIHSVAVNGLIRI